MERLSIARLSELTMAALLAVIGLAWVWNSNPWSGPVVFRLSDAHGVHSNDWISIAAWVSGLVLVERPRRAQQLAQRLTVASARSKP
jgi:hypothetical protein